MIEKISTSSDIVSTTLESIFLNVIRPTQEQINRAKLRKDVGNPPGKKQDPIGDQITWEQLLDNIQSDDKLYIITNDTDYFEKYSETDFYLNPFLLLELKERKIKEDQIFLCTKLIDALNKIKSDLPDLRLPERAMVEEIEIEESSPLTTTMPPIISGQGFGTTLNNEDN